MSDTSTHTHNTLPPRERLNSFSIKHLNALYDLLASKYGDATVYYNRANPASMVLAMSSTYTTSAINDAHHELVNQYKNKRGRPFGSKNKPKDNNNYSANANARATKQETFPQVDVDLDNDLDIDNSATNAVDANILRVVEPLMIECLEKAFNDYDRENTRKHDHHALGIERLNDTLATNLIELRERIDSLKSFQPTLVKLEQPNLPPIEMGIQHKMFPILLKMCSARQRNGYALNIWVHGPAGTGKSTAAEKVASALNLPFYTTGSLDAKHEVLGFENAHKYVTTAFRQAWEFGGVYCLDEADGSSPQAMLALNGALAGSLCAFPDKIVKRHKDCIIIATANTTGHGASSEYSGRFKQDAASMDRFQTLNWPIDETLERTMCANQDWVRTVQAMRAKLATRGIKGVMITPRATLAGEALIAAGLELSQVIESTLKKGMTDAQWSMVNN